MKWVALWIALLVFSSSALGVQYPGWKQSTDTRKNAIVFQPQDPSLKADIVVKYYPAALLEGHGLEAWLSQKLTVSQAPRGTWQNEPTIIRQTANFASGSRSYKMPDGRAGQLDALAFSADRQYVRLAVMIHTKDEANTPYIKQAIKILSDIAAVEKADAIAQQRGHDIEAAPPKVAGIKTGTPIKPGRYIGTKTREMKVLQRYELMLYDNGEYEFLNTNDAGAFVYSQATGRLNIEGDLYNSTYRPAEEFCIYGIDENTGQSLIYAEEGALSRYKHRLVWSNPVDRPSPAERKKADALAKAQAKRYKHVTNPGDGVTPDQIHTILYTVDTGYSGTQLALEESAYLLMKDGRVMDGVPVAPDMLDVALSRSREPDRWGWWKHDGERYRFAWNVDKNNFVIPKGQQIEAKPVPPGTLLEGNWQGSSSFASLDISMTSFWGVELSKKGRFRKYKNSLAQGGGEMSGLGPMVTVASDDEGSVVSVIGSNIGGGTVNRKNNPESDRMGWYEFDGYNLTLKFDNGTVSRLITFTTGEDFKTLWFEGGSLRRKDGADG